MKTNLLLRFIFPFNVSFLYAFVLYITLLNEIKSNASFLKPIKVNSIFFEDKNLLYAICSIKYDIINDLLKEKSNKIMLFKSNSTKNNYNSSIDYRELSSFTSFPGIVKSINNSNNNNYVIILRNNESYLMNIDYNNIKNISIQYNSFKIISNLKEDKIIDIINGVNYSIFITTNEYKNYFYNLSLFKCIYNIQNNKFRLNLISKKNYIYSKGKNINCFITRKNIISCFYLNLEYKYTIIIFDSNLIFKNNLVLNYRSIFYENQGSKNLKSYEFSIC
jgi:hypothetical protein